ncbi:MAG TPA: hypothetical protein VJ721_00655, partial [Chthoniobacterales bacterium]|nr:hypothetical protein [Chthoniobacterales bacterium]
QQKTETIAPAASPTPTPETPTESETPAATAEPQSTLPNTVPEAAESVNMTPFDPNGPSGFASPTPTP